MENALRSVLDRVELPLRDRGFVTELAYGYVRRSNSLDAVCAHLTDREIKSLDTPLRVAIGLGLYQFMYLETAPHAAVDATLTAFRGFASTSRLPASKVDRFVGLVNAVLRRATREIQHLPLTEGDPDAEDLLRGHDHWIRVPGLELATRARNRHARWAIQYSHPQEMVRLWSDRYEESVLLSILVHNNERPKTHLVVRADGPDLDAFESRLGDLKVRRTGAPRTLSVDAPGRIESLPGYDEGHFWVQDVTARRLGLMLPSPEGGTLLDLCSAPGGKLMSLLDRGGYASVLACDIAEDRLRRVGQNLVRLRLDTIPVEVAILDEDPATTELGREFDHVIVDVPCSNTGVLNRRHEARWRFLPENQREIVKKQKGLLRAAIRHVKRGGHVLYTTCSIEPEENSGVVHDILRSEPDLKLLEEREVVPGEAGGDGGYGALMTKRTE